MKLLLLIISMLGCTCAYVASVEGHNNINAKVDAEKLTSPNEVILENIDGNNKFTISWEHPVPVIRFDK